MIEDKLKGTVPKTLQDAAVAVLMTSSASEKTELTRRFVDIWRDGKLTTGGRPTVPDRPSRPSEPQLCPPAKLAKRSLGSAAGRNAFIHAIAHIELNAVDLAWDIVARFSGSNMPIEFYEDWINTALDEADHFDLLNERLQELGSSYGEFLAHDGLWEAADKTKDDLKARLALIPMVLEARGLDTAHMAASRLRSAGDRRTADIMDKIGIEEIPHVAVGVRWFEWLCSREGTDPIAAFHDIVRSRFNAKLKPPFNEEARESAGMSREYYVPLAT